jgi:hypothetical protein
MCRSIKQVSHIEPLATPNKIEAVARQFVRKVSVTDNPLAITEPLLNNLVTRT